VLVLPPQGADRRILVAYQNYYRALASFLDKHLKCSGFGTQPKFRILCYFLSALRI
jgi:hypothetical protein